MSTGGRILVTPRSLTEAGLDAVAELALTLTLCAYAVDAFDAEPPELTALLRHDRVIATPHLGGYTHASVRRATSVAVQNLLAVLKKGTR